MEQRSYKETNFLNELAKLDWQFDMVGMNTLFKESIRITNKDKGKWKKNKNVDSRNSVQESFFFFFYSLFKADITNIVVILLIYNMLIKIDWFDVISSRISSKIIKKYNNENASAYIQIQSNKKNETFQVFKIFWFSLRNWFCQKFYENPKVSLNILA